MSLEPTENVIEPASPAATPGASRSGERIHALDVWRGMMVLFGVSELAMPVALRELSSDHANYIFIHWMYTHSTWNGVTLFDLGFPSFVFVMGMSIALARSENTGRGGMELVAIARRTILLFVIGVLADTWYHSALGVSVDRPRLLTGVLQTLAVAYLGTAIIGRLFSGRGRMVVTVTVLLLYSLFLLYVHAPGKQAGEFTRADNAAAYLDHLLLPNWVGVQPGDPPLLGSRVGVLATSMLGLCAGGILKKNVRERAVTKAGYVLVGLGLILLNLTWLVSQSIPINRLIWTPSFSLLAAALTSALIGLLLFVCDSWGYRRWTLPFSVMSRHALSAFLIGYIIPYSWLMERGHQGIWKASFGDAGPLAVTFAIMAAVWGVFYVLDRSHWRFHV